MKRYFQALAVLTLLLTPVLATAATTCVNTSVDYSNPSSSSSGNVCSSGNQTIIVTFALDLIKFFGGLIGLLVVLAIIIGGIQYITSSGNPQAVAAAKGRISNAVLVLVLYILMVGILSFLIPGLF